MLRWEAVAAADGARPGARRSHCLGKLPGRDNDYVVFGGYDGGVLGDAWTLTLDLARESTATSLATWAPAEAPPTPRHDHMVAALAGGELFLAGGMGGANLCLGETRRLDGGGGGVTDAALPVPRANGALVGLADGGALLFGGFTGERCLDDLWRWRPRPGAWRRLGDDRLSRPSERGGHAMVVVRGAGGREVAYTFGGWTGARDMLADTWSLDVAAAEDAAARAAAAEDAAGERSRPWRREVPDGAAPSSRSCYSLTVIARPETGPVGARCVLYGGLGSDWRARRPEVFVVEYPRPAAGGRGPGAVLYSTVAVGGPIARPVAFHSAAAPPRDGGGGTFAPLVVVYGGGDSGGALAKNAGEVAVLRRVLYDGRNAALFGSNFRAVGLALASPAASRVLHADVWLAALQFCASTWFGDDDPPPPPGVDVSDDDLADDNDDDDDEDAAYDAAAYDSDDSWTDDDDGSGASDDDGGE